MEMYEHIVKWALDAKLKQWAEANDNDADEATKDDCLGMSRRRSLALPVQESETIQQQVAGQFSNFLRSEETRLQDEVNLNMVDIKKELHMAKLKKREREKNKVCCCQSLWVSGLPF